MQETFLGCLLGGCMVLFPTPMAFYLPRTTWHSRTQLPSWGSDGFYSSRMAFWSGLHGIFCPRTQTWMAFCDNFWKWEKYFSPFIFNPINQGGAQ